MGKSAEQVFKYNKAINFALILVITMLTINRYGPLYLNADIILNSIMSLQNVTLFYWGQDRLFNFIPILLSVIRNPVLNLLMVMFLTALFYYILLWYLSCCFVAGIAQDAESRVTDCRLFFLFLVAGGLILFKEYTIFNLTIWLVQFTISYSLLAAVHAYLTRCDFFDSYDTLLLFAMIFLATGLNNSIIIPLLMMVTVLVFANRQKLRQGILLSVVAVFVFALWAMFSARYPSPGVAYIALELEGFFDNLTAAMLSITEAVNSSVLFVFIAFFIAAVLVSVKWKKAGLLATFGALLLFIVGWFIIFANNPWVITNVYHFRYFFPILMSFLYLGIASLWLFLQKVSVNYFKSILTVVLVIIIITALAAPLTALSDYAIFWPASELEKVRGNDVTAFHAGHYWDAWPAVYYDLMKGRFAYGFAYRAEGNLAGLQATVEAELKKRGQLEVYCHSGSAEDCLEQVLSRVGGLQLDSRKSLIPGVELLVFVHAFKATDQVQ